MAKISPQEQRRIQQEQDRIYRQVQRVMQTMYHKTFTLPEIKQAIKKVANSPEERAFWFREFPAAEKAFSQLVKNINKEVQTIVLTGIESEWKAGETYVWSNGAKALVETEAENAAFNLIRREATAGARSESAMQSFIRRKEGGYTLSERIWRTTAGAKQEIEVIIQNGIKEGMAADDIARSVQKYLLEPNKLFRRVRNKATGKLELSAAARKYHPGQGVYRSSFRNALRLVSTEINRAYRTAQWQNFQNNPLVIGYEIRLSNNHTCSDGKGGTIPGWTDMCDELAGKYPKWFKWAGWHPNCRCHIIAILISKDDFAARIQARANDTLDSWKPKGTIKDVPEAFKAWAAENMERIDQAASTPYWVQDNFNNGMIADGLFR